MATPGSIVSIDPSGTTGKVAVSGTNEKIAINDPKLPGTGLKVGDACSFVVEYDSTTGDYYADQFAVLPTGKPQTITAPYSGPDLTANLGDTITITAKGSSDPSVTCNVTINGGIVIVDGGAVLAGSVNVGGGIVEVKGMGQVKGSISINTGGSLKVVKMGNVSGTVHAGQAGRIMVGNTEGAGTINGTIDVKGGLRGLQVCPNSQIISK
ncbi:MAG: hypothetical protein ABI388_02395 [Bacteroidia bacterium]